MARVWIEVFTKMLFLLPFHSVLFPPFCPKPDEGDAYSWLVDAINSLKIESRPETSESSDRKDETTPQTCADSTTNSFSDITLRLQNIQEENRIN